MVGRTGIDMGSRRPDRRRAVCSGRSSTPPSATSSEVDRETLLELVLSRSYCAVLSEEERAPVLESVDDLFTEHARDGVLRLPYLTECFRATRR